MARVKCTMSVVNKANKIINSFYDLGAENIDDIYRCSNNSFDMIINAFKFGYVQGFKAAKADNNNIGCEV